MVFFRSVREDRFLVQSLRRFERKPCAVRAIILEVGAMDPRIDIEGMNSWILLLLLLRGLLT